MRISWDKDGDEPRWLGGNNNHKEQFEKFYYKAILNSLKKECPEVAANILTHKFEKIYGELYICRTCNIKVFFDHDPVWYINLPRCYTSNEVLIRNILL